MEIFGPKMEWVVNEKVLNLSFDPLWLNIQYLGTIAIASTGTKSVKSN